MEGKRKIVLLLVTAGLIWVLMLSLFGLGSQPVPTSVFALPESPQSSESASLVLAVPPPGVTYTGSYIKIGVNNGGTFCVADGTGFQYPIGPGYESLAIGSWVEGYLLAYKIWNATSKKWEDRIAYWWPHLGWPPPLHSRIVPIYAVQRRNDSNRAIWEARVQTVDKVLNVTFKFSFPKPQKYVLLETKITNTGALGEVRDLLYKRIVDWDVHGNTNLNRWTNDDHAAYASYFNNTLNKWIDMTVAGYTPNTLENQVSYVDLYAWDDIYVAKLRVSRRDPGKMDIQSHDQPLTGDGNAAVYYDLGNIASKSTKTVTTVYQAGWHYDHGITAALLNTLIIKVDGPGKTSPSPGTYTYTYSSGTVVSVTAIPDSGAYFNGWWLDGKYAGGATTISITMCADHELLATFGIPT